MSESQSFQVPAHDGYLLRARRYANGSRPRALVLINGAVGVRQQYYRRFAQFLLDRDLEVVTYDYRGIGESAPRRLRGFSARMRDWGLLDQPGMIDWCQSHQPEVPLIAVGHSVGGQILGLAPNNHAVAGLVGVCAQKTWWGLWPKRSHPQLILLWYLVMPGVAHTMGYFPSPWFGLGENLPKGVAVEWAQWARSRDHTPEAIGEHVRPGYANYPGAILSYSFADDTFAPRRAIEGLLDQYASARRQLRHVEPAEVGRPIGHFGYFRPEFADTLWAETRDWILDQSEP